MKNKIIQILSDASEQDPMQDSYEVRVVRDNDFESIAESIVKLSPVPAIGGVWVNVNDRLPDYSNYPKYHIEDTNEPGIVFKNLIHSSVMLLFPSHNRPFAKESYDKMGEGWESDNWYWLDESGTDRIAELEKEVEELREWKRQATEVMPDFQAIGKEMGIPLGKSISDKILPWITAKNMDSYSLRQEVIRLKELIEYSMIKGYEICSDGYFKEELPKEIIRFKKEHNL